MTAADTTTARGTDTTGRAGHWDTIIVGGGIVGLSTAFHLRERDLGSVLVLDAGPVGSGASGLGTGMVVTQRFEPLDVQLVLRSLELIKQLGDLTNGLVTLYRTGRLALVAHEDVEGYDSYIQGQRAAGATLEVMAPAQMVARYPFMNVDDVALGVLTEADGTVHPPLLVATLCALIKQRGGIVWEGMQVGRIQLSGSGGGTVELRHGEKLSASRIIVACGPWTSEILAPSGFPLPQAHVRTEAGVAIIRDPRIDGTIPGILDGVTGTIHVPRNPGLVHVSTGMGESGIPGGEKLADWRAGSARGRTVSEEMIASCVKAVEHRFPQSAPVHVEKGWAGITDLVPDHNPFIGAYPGTDGLFVACGLSGYGIMRGLAVGETLAAISSGAGGGVDVTGLRLDRMDLTQVFEPDWVADNPLVGFRNWTNQVA